jgi:hypothetical protein
MTSDKRKIFLAPVSSSNLYKNYHKSVVSGLSNSDFFNYSDTSTYKQKFGDKKVIRLWGIKNVKKTAFNRAEISDIILFYHKGFIVGKTEIIFKDTNKKLSDSIWGHDYDKQEYWENLVFLDKYEELNIDFKVLIEFADYSPKASVRGFNIYSSNGLNAILNQHKTLDSFLKEHNK